MGLCLPIDGAVAVFPWCLNGGGDAARGIIGQGTLRSRTRKNGAVPWFRSMAARRTRKWYGTALSSHWLARRRPDLELNSVGVSFVVESGLNDVAAARPTLGSEIDAGKSNSGDGGGRETLEVDGF